MNFEDKLTRLGLEVKEAKVYLKALELQTFSVAAIAHASGLKRPTCYLILAELQRKGYVTLVPHSTKVLYHVESPEVLVKQAEYNVAMARDLESDLKQRFAALPAQVPTVRVYTGQKGVQNIYEDMLRYRGDGYCYIGSMKELIATAGEEFLRAWIKRRIVKGLHVRAIRIGIEELEDAEGSFTAQAEALRETRYAPAHVYLKDAIMIYGRKVAIIGDQKSNFAFVVENKEFASSMMSLFEAIWKISTPLKPSG